MLSEDLRCELENVVRLHLKISYFSYQMRVFDRVNKGDGTLAVTGFRAGLGGDARKHSYEILL